MGRTIERITRSDGYGQPAESQVLGIALPGQVRAYPLALLKKSGGVTADSLDGRKVFVLWYEPTRTAAIFAAEVDDPDSRQSITLTADEKEPSTPFTDRETGSRWDIAGRAITGTLKGQTLRWLPGVQCRWFAWAAEYPETEIFKGDEARPPAGNEGKKGASAKRGAVD